MQKMSALGGLMDNNKNRIVMLGVWWKLLQLLSSAVYVLFWSKLEQKVLLMWCSMGRKPLEHVSRLESCNMKRNVLLFLIIKITVQCACSLSGSYSCIQCTAAHQNSGRSSCELTDNEWSNPVGGRVEWHGLTPASETSLGERQRSENEPICFPSLGQCAHRNTKRRTDTHKQTHAATQEGWVTRTRGIHWALMCWTDRNEEEQEERLEVAERKREY